ncbi:MAG: beta-ketoacyl-ACP synthase II [Anaerolineae bacterium]
MSSPRTNGRRVVVTGLGVISPIGNSAQEFWQNLLNGKYGVRPIANWEADGYPAHFAGIVEDFDPIDYLDRQQARRMDRFTQFAIAAAMDAVKHAGLELDAEDGDRVGVSLGTAVAGMGVVERESQTLAIEGPRRVSPMLIPSVIGNMAACMISIMLKVRGPALCPTGACATGCMAIGEAFERIVRGELDVVLAGGSDSTITPLAVASFGRLGALSRRTDEPALACRPFDVDRDGTVLAEGAAVLVLESEEHAVARGAGILAELSGYGVTSDAYHVAAPDPNGIGAAKSMRTALSRAGVSAADVQWVCAHGTGTPLNDISESKAIRDVLGAAADMIPVSSNKHAIGHTLGAAGAISSVAAVQAIRSGVIPGTLNLKQKDPECRINAIAENVSAEVVTVLVNAFGFGGQNASLVFRRWPG